MIIILTILGLDTVNGEAVPLFWLSTKQILTAVLLLSLDLFVVLSLTGSKVASRDKDRLAARYAHRGLKRTQLELCPVKSEAGQVELHSSWWLLDRRYSVSAVAECVGGGTSRGRLTVL